MRIIYFGHNQRGIKILETLLENNYEVVCAVGQTGEGGWYESIGSTAQKYNINFIECLNPNKEEFLKILSDYNPDLGIMCGYSKYIGKKVRDSFPKGMINLHASNLPYYRGAAPLNWALINGEEVIGLSIYFIDEGIDTGPILLQRKIPVDPNDSIKELLPRTIDAYSEMILEACSKIERNDYTLTYQDLNEGTYFTKRRPKDGEIIWEKMDDKAIHNLVRALTAPYPGAFFMHQGKKVYVWKTALEKKEFKGIPGRVATKKDDGIVVIAKNRGIRLMYAQKEDEESKDPASMFKVGEDLL